MNPTEGCVVESDHWGALCIGATGRGASTDTAVDPGTQPAGMGRVAASFGCARTWIDVSARRGR
jgi:hypothetical protein